MMHPSHYLIALALLGATACTTSPIKNEGLALVVEPGTIVAGEQPIVSPMDTTRPLTTTDLIGYWVGMFENATEKSGPIVAVDDHLFWRGANKINLSIDRIEGEQVWGHSVVAGNDRPFEGRLTEVRSGVYHIVAQEPGDHRYDGVFDFTLQDSTLKGTWRAYQELPISEREYTLRKRVFEYDPMREVDHSLYIDWLKTKNVEVSNEYEDGGPEYYLEEALAVAYGDYELNASWEELTPAEVENLSKGDLIVLRNSIYARHGYSFKYRPLRIFFDAQPWYVPVHADIRSEFTETEKKNIALLLRYEKNAAEYYGTFGR